MDSKESSRSWFCVLNNPQEIYIGEPHEIVDRVLEEWCQNYPTRTGAVAYCISSEGLHHLHMVLEDSNKVRFSALKKVYPKAHLEPTKGTKEQAEDYIHKRGKFEEKGEQVVYIEQHGEIKGAQGQRKDLENIADLIETGKTPNEILDMNFAYRKYEKMIRDGYYRKRYKETPIQRELKSYWHLGESGTGKTYTFVNLVKKHGADNVYMVNDYNNPFDKYNGEPVIFLDEFRGQMQFFKMLNTILSEYRVQVPCRYANVYALWSEVHITSVLPPELVYGKMVHENRDLDSFKQLMRRISYLVYHYVDEDGKYKEYELSGKQYTTYEELRTLAESDETDDSELIEFFENSFASPYIPASAASEQLEFQEVLENDN